MRHKDFNDMVIHHSVFPPSKNALKKLVKMLIMRYVRYRLAGRTKPYKYLFLLCPARSGSSLMLHLLNSNPEISGYGENHVSYTTNKDLQYLALRTCWDLKKFDMSESFFLDKIVFNYHPITPQILQSDSVFVIFLLRDPLDNLSSILRIWHDVTEESVQRYYCDRLAQMEEYAQLVESRERCFFLRYEQLLEDGESVLKALQETMEIQHPFSEQYDLIPTHGYGKLRRGDSSQNLQKGKIIRPQKDAYNFDTDFFKDSLAAYERCCATLSQCCTTYPGVSDDRSAAS